MRMSVEGKTHPDAERGRIDRTRPNELSHRIAPCKKLAIKLDSEKLELQNVEGKLGQ
jgi:hypothetical protein